MLVNIWMSAVPIRNGTMPEREAGGLWIQRPPVAAHDGLYHVQSNQKN